MTSAFVTPQQLVAHMLGGPARAAADAAKRAEGVEELADCILNNDNLLHPMTPARREALYNTLTDDFRALFSTPIPECTAYGVCHVEVQSHSAPPEKVAEFKKAQQEKVTKFLEAHHKEYNEKAGALLNAAINKVFLKALWAVLNNYTAVQVHRAIKDDISTVQKELRKLHVEYSTIDNVKMYGVNL